MRLKIAHSTRYDFDAPVGYGLQQLRKTPKSTESQNVLNWSTRIEGGQKELHFQDHHRNHVELVSYTPGTRSLVVVSEGEVELTETHGIAGAHRGYAPLWLFRRTTALTDAGAGCDALLRQLPAGADIDRFHALSASIGDSVAYETGKSQTHWTAEDVLSAGHGV